MLREVIEGLFVELMDENSGEMSTLYLSKGSSEDWPRGVRIFQRMVRSPRFSSVVRDIREAAAAVSFPHFGGTSEGTNRKRHRWSRALTKWFR